MSCLNANNDNMTNEVTKKHTHRQLHTFIPTVLSYHSALCICFSFFETWWMVVSVCFHNLVTYAHKLKDLSACLMFWMRTHTGPRVIASSEWRESHQPKVSWASRTNSKIMEPRTYRIQETESLYRCTIGSLPSTLVFLTSKVRNSSTHHRTSAWKSIFKIQVTLSWGDLNNKQNITNGVRSGWLPKSFVCNKSPYKCLNTQMPKGGNQWQLCLGFIPLTTQA
jgi:hypothetical protein